MQLSILILILDNVLTYCAMIYIYYSFCGIKTTKRWQKIILPFLTIIGFCFIPLSIKSYVMKCIAYSCVGLISASMFQKKLYIKLGLGLMGAIIQFTAELVVTSILSKICDYSVLTLSLGFYARAVIYARLVALAITVCFSKLLAKRLSLSVKASLMKSLWLLLLSTAGFFVLNTLFNILIEFQNNNYMLQILVCIGIVCIIWLYLLFNEFEMQEQKFIKQKYSYMEEIQKIQEETWREITEKNKKMRILIHDVKNFMLLIRGYLESGRIETVKEKLNDYLDEMIENQAINSGIWVFDTVLSAKEQLAKTNEITFSCSILLNEEDLNIDPVDIARIFSNALDNAIEAASQIEEKSKRYINLKIHTVNDYLHIAVENTIAQPVIIKNNCIETTKEEKDLHGIGISSMKMLAERYDGTVALQCKDNIFSTMIVLNNKKDDTRK